MNRRQALIRIPLLAGAAVVSYGGFKWIRWNSEADIDYLYNSKKIIAVLSDTIIPRTDTPGAGECDVEDFIIKMIINCTDTISQNKFINGLKELENQSQTDYGKLFIECTPDQRIHLLKEAERKAVPYSGLVGKIEKKYLGSSFFTTLKRYTIIGYCSSEKGATEGLRYSHIPSKYIACQPYIKGEKAWATS